MSCRYSAPVAPLPLLLKAYEMLWFPAAGAWAAAAGDRRLRNRLALNLPRRRPAPGAVWVHALSVGEVLSALPLVGALRNGRPTTELVFSAATEQGLDIAAQRLSGAVAQVLAMPLDFPWAARRIIDHIRPSLFVLVETDIWPGLLGCLAQREVPCLLVNGRISPATFGGYRRLAPLVRTLFRGFSMCLMQTDIDRQRLLSIGVPPHRVRTVGNIKFDHAGEPMGPAELTDRQKQLGLQPTDRVWVAGSTHPGEDPAVLSAFRRLIPDFPNLRLIVAPRRIETAGAISDLARRMGLAVHRRSAGAAERGWQVLVLDTIGELGRIYGLAQVSFVGGSLVATGGHNLLEPAAFGRPVLFGPHTFNFELMARELEESGGGIRVADENGLYTAIFSLFGDEQRYAACGRAAGAYVARNRGAVGQVKACITDILGPPEPAAGV